MARVVSWNLNGLEPQRLDERSAAAMERLLAAAHPPEVLLLQEVTGRTFFAHIAPALAASGYLIVPPQPPEVPYFCVVAVRAPLVATDAWMRPFPNSSMGRALLGVVLDGFGTVMTAHLESGKGAGTQRMSQARTVIDMMQSIEGPALFAGDTNLREAERKAVFEGIEGIEDAWSVAGEPSRAKFTWLLGGGGPKARFDQAWHQGLVQQSFALLSPKHPELGPLSDHYGLDLELG